MRESLKCKNSTKTRKPAENKAEFDKQILELHSQGLNDAEIARRLGVKYRSIIQYHRVKLGLKAYRKRAVKIVDEERFKQLWFSDVFRRKIADEFGCSLDYVSAKARSLGLPRREHLIGLSGLRHQREVENNILGFLQKTEQGYSRVSEMPHITTVRRLVNEGRLLRVRFSFKKGSGNYRRRTDRKCFNKGFYERTFICLDRTALVRLFMHALKKPTSSNVQRRITSLCKRYLTHAEWVAVLWSLGIQTFSQSQLKRNMQVDGLYFPLSHKSEVSE